MAAAAGERFEEPPEFRLGQEDEVSRPGAFQAGDARDPPVRRRPRKRQPRRSASSLTVNPDAPAASGTQAVLGMVASRSGRPPAPLPRAG